MAPPAHPRRAKRSAQTIRLSSRGTEALRQAGVEAPKGFLQVLADAQRHQIRRGIQRWKVHREVVVSQFVFRHEHEGWFAMDRTYCETPKGEQFTHTVASVCIHKGLPTQGSIWAGRLRFHWHPCQRSNLPRFPKAIVGPYINGFNGRYLHISWRHHEVPRNRYSKYDMQGSFRCYRFEIEPKSAPET